MWYSRLRAAVNARQESGSDIVIIARTDARQQLGFEEVVERLQGAVGIGVDIVFPEALLSKEEAKRICDIMGPVPVFLNMVTNGITPEISAKEARDLGFKIIIFPGAALQGAISGMQGSIGKLKQEGRQSATVGYPGAKGALCFAVLQNVSKSISEPEERHSTACSSLYINSFDYNTLKLSYFLPQCYDLYACPLLIKSE